MSNLGNRAHAHWKMWREKYEEILARHAAASGASGSAGEELLDAVMEATGEGDEKSRWSAIGRELLAPKSALCAAVGKAARQEKIALLEMQVVCRLLMCCKEGVFVLEDASPSQLQTAKKSKSKAKTKSKKKGMDARTELRELLDRVALLLDSANPPSIAESEDEPSPFHHFLLAVLERRLRGSIPEVFAYLRDEYELTEDPIAPLQLVQPMPIAKTSSAPQEEISPSSSILSALKEEKPSAKRRLSGTSDSFKQVQLPEQLSKPRRSISLGVVRSQALDASTRTQAKRRLSGSSESSLVSLAAASKRVKPTRQLGGPAKPLSMPLLVRDVDRQLLPSRTGQTNGLPSRPSSASHTGTLKVPVPTRSATTSRLPSSAVTNLSRASVVLRTPDRPQRMQRSQPRILIESSPPLRNPFATARTARRPGSQLPQ